MSTLDHDNATSAQLADAGITRLRPAGNAPLGCLPFVVGVLALFLVGSVVVPVIGGDDLLGTLGIVVAGVILPLPLFWTSSRAVYVAWMGVLLATGIAFVGAVPNTDNPEITWVTATASGFIIVLSRRARREEAARLASAQGAPAGPRATNSRDVGVRAVWNSGEFDYEAQDPDLTLATAVLDALDGRRRTTLTVFHGRGRLDISGESAGRLLVSALRLESRGERDYFYAGRPDPALDGSATGSVASCEFLLARSTDPITVPEYMTVDRAVACQALDHWLRTGQRDPDLRWHRDEKNEIPVGPLTSVG